MGRGRGGGGGGDGGGVGDSRFRFFRGFKIGGPYPGTNDVLQRVATARGLRDVDQLLVVLGKERTDISLTEALDLLEKDAGVDAVMDARNRIYYTPGKGYKRCNLLLKWYLHAMENPIDDLGPTYPEYNRRDLEKHCGYTDDELNSLC